MVSDEQRLREIVENYKQRSSVSPEDAAAFWERLVAAHPEVDQIVLVRRPTPRDSAQSNRSFRWSPLALGCAALILGFGLGKLHSASASVSMVATQQPAAEPVAVGDADRAAQAGTESDAAPQRDADAEKSERLKEVMYAQSFLQQASASQETATYTVRTPPDARTASAGLSDRGEAKLKRCRDAYRRGELEEADARCAESLASDPKHPPTLNMLGRIAADRGWFDISEKRYREALALDRDSVPALLGLSTCLALRGDLSGAEDAVVHALELNPKHERAAEIAASIARRRHRRDTRSQVMTPGRDR